MPIIYHKDPSAILDYYVDWTAWLGADTITLSTWAKTGDITLGSGMSLGALQGIWVSGGTVHTHAVLTNHIVTTAGRQDERSMVLVLRDL
jgi:hypothetical protein